MQKSIVSILLICYMAVSTGVMVNAHYCMNKLDSTSFFTGKADRCGKCGMHTDKSHGCCRDEVKLIKMDDDQKINPAFAFSLPLLVAEAPAPSTFFNAILYNAFDGDEYNNHSPPIAGPSDIYLQNRVFRI